MFLIKEGKTNWKYILIVIILAAIVGGGIWWFAEKQKMPPLSEVTTLGKTSFISPQSGEQWEIGESHTIEIRQPVDESYPFTHLTLNKPDGEEVGIISCKIGGTGETVFTWETESVLNYCGAGLENKTKEIEAGNYVIAITKDTEERPILATSKQFSIVANETADWETYRNEEYGFEVKYSPDWVLKGSLISKNNCHFDIYTLTKEKYNEMITYAEGGGTNGCSVDDFSVNKINAKEVRCNAKWDAENYNGYYISSLNLRIFPWDEKDFNLMPGEPIPTDFLQCNNIFNQMLSVFRFLEEIKTGKVKIDYENIAEIQKSVDKGHQPWQLNPIMVLRAEMWQYGFDPDKDFDTIKNPSTSTQAEFGKSITKLSIEVNHESKAYIVTLIQPIAGEGKIWTISEIGLKE